MCRAFKENIIIIIAFFVYTIKAQTVSTASELQNAISTASAGSEIVLANGIWNNVFIDITKDGTATQPITIKAQNSGSVFMTGNSRVYMRGNYVTVSGLVFQNPSNLIENGSTIEPVFELNQCNNCKVTNNKIDAYNGTDAQKTLKFKWVLIVDGKHNEISHNSFIGKYGVGSIINDNRSNASEDYLKIHHNYFADRVPVDNDINGLNDQDAIRIGTSSTSLSSSYSEVYDNYFYNWSGEVEIISNKSGKNKYYNNTFRDYQGTLTLRHGNNCEVFNNYFFANNNPFTGGVRIIGEGHKVYNNYIEGVNSFKPSGSGSNVTGGINVMNGVTNSPLNGYYQVKNVQVVNNTLVNCDYAIRIGTSLGGTEEPENLVVANNIMYNTSINAYQINTSPSGASVVEGNITQNGSWDLSNTNSNQTVSNGLLERGTEFYRIIDGSPAIDASIGSYSFLNDDVLGGSRTGKADSGAEELNSNGTNLPYTNADVGEKIGFLSNISNHLTATVTSVDFNIESGSKTFDIVSNIDWFISENSDWLSLNTTNGSNNATIEVTVTKNTTGVPRSAILTISENNGDLKRTIIVNQSLETFNVDDAKALTGVTVTGVGTQEPNIPENTIDGDDTTRWSANSTNGSAYLTYNLGCKKTVTAVKIYFHKGNQRTSSFKIASSNDGTNFTDVTSVITSSGTTEGFEHFPFSPFQEAKYIRIYGYGNSEGSGWNSYEEVQIFGDDACKSLSTENFKLNNNVLIFPNPAKNKIQISSKNPLKYIQIFDVKGRKLYAKSSEKNNETINIEQFSKGIYFIQIANKTHKIVID